MSYKSEPPKKLSKREAYNNHVQRLKEQPAELLVQRAPATKPAELSVHDEQATTPEEIKIEPCDGDISETIASLGNFGAAYDKQAEDELRGLIEARGRKKKFGGSGYRW